MGCATSNGSPRRISAPTWHLHTKLYKFRWNCLPNNAVIKNHTDLNLGDVFCLSIIYHIPYSWLNILNGYDFYFRCKPLIGSKAIQAKRPGTSKNQQIECTFSIRKFHLGILAYLSRNLVFPRKIPFGETKLICPFTFHPKFPDFLRKW